MKKETTRQPGPAGNYDYVEHGSERHAQQMGLRKADENDDLQYHGWTLMDRTFAGPAATDGYYMNVLRQHVSVLETKPEPPQSDDPLAPNYAPPMWVPPAQPAGGLTY